MMFNKLLVIFWNWMLQVVILLEDPIFPAHQLLPEGEQVTFQNVSPNRTFETSEEEGMYLYRSHGATNSTFEAHATTLNSSHYQRVSKVSTWLSEVLTPVANWVVGMFQRPPLEDGLTLADPWKLPDAYKTLIAEQPNIVQEMLSNPRLNILTRRRHIPPAYDYIPADAILTQSHENMSQPHYLNHGNVSATHNYTENVQATPMYLQENGTHLSDGINVLSDAEQLSEQDSFFVSYIVEAENQYEKFLLYKKKEEAATDSRLIYFNTESTEYNNQDSFQKRSGVMFSPDEETPRERLSRVCGRPYFSRRYRRLVNGRPSTPGQWPWMGYVAESTNLLSKSWLTYHGCGGVLITEKFVATASHCWKHIKNDEFNTRLHVQFGTTEFYDPSNNKNHSDRYQVLRMYTHSEFDAKSYKNDITLLELKNPVNFTYKVLPVCLPSPGQDFEGEMAIVIGWGQLNYRSTRVSRVQQYVDVPIISRDTCQRWFDISPENATVLPGHMCAGYVEGGKDACKGDSGGPLVVRDRDSKWVLAGTVSHGFGCAEPFKPGLYSNVTYFLPWILNIVDRNNNTPSQK